MAWPTVPTYYPLHYGDFNYIPTVTNELIQVSLAIKKRLMPSLIQAWILAIFILWIRRDCIAYLEQLRDIL